MTARSASRPINAKKRIEASQNHEGANAAPRPLSLERPRLAFDPGARGGGQASARPSFFRVKPAWEAAPSELGPKLNLPNPPPSLPPKVHPSPGLAQLPNCALLRLGRGACPGPGPPPRPGQSGLAAAPPKRRGGHTPWGNPKLGRGKG